MSGRLPAFVTVAILLVSAAVAAQQTLSAHTLLGRVTDSSGRALPGVTVELSNPAAGGSLRSVTTDREGRYQIEKVLPGVYVLTVRLSGFGSAIRDLEIGSGTDDFEFDVQLKPLAPGTPPSPAASQLPRRRVVCGMTVISPPPGQNADPGIFAPKAVPPGAETVKPTIRAIQPTLCWESSSDSRPAPPNR